VPDPSDRVKRVSAVFPPDSPEAKKQVYARAACYPQLLRFGNRHLIFYSNLKMDIRVKEIPDELLSGVGIPAFHR